MPEQKTKQTLEAVHHKGYVFSKKKGDIELRDVEFDREDTSDSKKEESLVDSLQNFSGKRVVYSNPNNQQANRKEQSDTYIDIEITDTDLKLIIPCDNEFTMKSILNMLNMPMESGAGGQLTFNFDDARFLHNPNEGIRTYYFSINENTVHQVKQNLIFVVSSSGIWQRYGIRGIGVYERNPSGRLEKVSQNILTDWLVSL